MPGRASQDETAVRLYHADATAVVERWPALMHGLMLSAAGMAAFVITVAVALLLFPFLGDRVTAMAWPVFGAIGIVLWVGIALACVDLFVLLPRKRRPNVVIQDAPRDMRVTVVLTAYNDEQSIGLAVDDFRSHGAVARVIVVDNNSSDRTSAVAREHGATVCVEPKPGYGQCVYRALSEGLACDDTELTLLCEGDMTFRAYDIDKFLAYIGHADIVNGTRIVEQLRSRDTQLTTFMYYGNFLVGKLLETRHIGKGTFTDVGTTYKLCRNQALRRLLPLLQPRINLAFNAHFLDTALRSGLHLLECPITFHNRVGKSKGGNMNDLRAFAVGVSMIKGIVFGWGSHAG